MAHFELSITLQNIVKSCGHPSVSLILTIVIKTMIKFSNILLTNLFNISGQQDSLND